MALGFFGLLHDCCCEAGSPPPGPEKVATEIDRLLYESWKRAGIEPCSAADDATFLRRVYLDLVGRIPMVSEAREFSDRGGPGKRAALVDRLLRTDRHCDHFAAFWRHIWIPQTDTPRFALQSDGFEAWLSNRLRQGGRHDAIVRELISATLARPQQSGLRGDLALASKTFLTVNENRPENLAAGVAAGFLGVDLACAQCHDHPFGRWTRQQFWETAAFFSLPAPSAAMTPDGFRAEIPGVNRTVAARFLTESGGRWPEKLQSDSGRRVLAEWITAKDNPWFARNAVNVLWSKFFGIRLLETPANRADANSSWREELLDRLATFFQDSGYDTRRLTKAIILCRAYQLSSADEDGNNSDSRRALFALMRVRALTGEQLYDSLRTASGMPAENADNLETPTNGAAPARFSRHRFVAMFPADATGAAPRSIGQALLLMNGQPATGPRGASDCPAVRATAEAPFLSTSDKIETLFLAAYARKPAVAEIEPLARYVDRQSEGRSSNAALGNVFRALLNSVEFNTNH